MRNLSVFSDRLQELMADNEVTPNMLSKAVDIDFSMVYRWIRGEFYPQTKTLIKIVQYFSCNMDFILGRSEDNCKKINKEEKEFGTRLCGILNNKGITEYQLCKDTGISRSRFYDWKKNIRIPNPENLIILANYLDVSIDYLIGRC